MKDDRFDKWERETTMGWRCKLEVISPLRDAVIVSTVMSKITQERIHNNVLNLEGELLLPPTRDMTDKEIKSAVFHRDHGYCVGNRQGRLEMRQKVREAMQDIHDIN